MENDSNPELSPDPWISMFERNLEFNTSQYSLFFTLRIVCPLDFRSEKTPTILLVNWWSSPIILFGAYSISIFMHHWLLPGPHLFFTMFYLYLFSLFGTNTTNLFSSLPPFLLLFIHPCFIMQLWLAWNWLHSPGCPWIHRALPASLSANVFPTIFREVYFPLVTPILS